jgi:hypothetical protein
MMINYNDWRVNLRLKCGQKLNGLEWTTYQQQKISNRGIFGEPDKWNGCPCRNCIKKGEAEEIVSVEMVAPPSTGSRNILEQK